MTIRRGEEWGVETDRPADAVTVRTDRELQRLVDETLRSGRPVPPVDLRGGDLARTLGVPAGSGDPAGARWRALPVDLGKVTINGESHWFAAHLVARRSWWTGPVIAAMNAQFVGPWDVAPRSHPNDGRLDVLEVGAKMPVRDRWRARRRLPLGTHVPHPAISTQRLDRLWIEADRTLDLFLDGVRIARVRTALVEIEADAATVYVSTG